MRSKASYRGHPLHPALIPLPFAFLTGALVFDGVAWLVAWPSGWTTGGHLAAAGVLTALLAAIPGLVDYVYTVPPRSSGKRRATRHMLFNLSAVALIATAWAVRPSAPANGLATVALETIGVALLVVGGWMGGVLVSRNQIGIDHRYAGAGKWKEATLDARLGAPITVASVEDLQVDQMKLLRLGDRRIVLARTESGYVAFDDRCTHRGGSLAGGTMICGIVQCPWHGSQFDVRTGIVKTGPSTEPISTYRSDISGDDVRLTL